MTLKTCTIAVIFSITAATTQADTINFDDITVGSTFGTGELLDDDYASQGVNFESGWEILNSPPSFGLALGPPSPPNVIVQQAAGANFLDISFDFNIDSFGATVVADFVLTWTIDYYLDAALVSSVSVVNGDEVPNSFLSTGILANRVTFSSPNNGVIDSLNFTPAIVPLPAGGLLLLSGLGGLAALRRRNKRTA